MTNEEDIYLSRAELDPNPESFMRGVVWARDKSPKIKLLKEFLYRVLKENTISDNLYADIQEELHYIDKEKYAIR